MVPDEPSCPRCAIEVARVTTLGPPAEISGYTASVARDRRGRFFVIDQSQGPVLVFDAGSPEVRQLGRVGDGPGEFRWPGLVRIDPADSIHVLDRILLRHSVFTPDLRFVRSTPLPVRAILANGLIRRDGTLILNAVTVDPEGIGYPLLAFTPSGRRIAAFGAEDPTYDPLDQTAVYRSLGNGREDRLWSVEPFSYTVTSFSTDFRIESRFVRRGWFRPLGPVAPGVPRTSEALRWQMQVRGAWEDEAGLLWTVTEVPRRPPGGLGRGRLRKAADLPVTQSVVEAIDPDAKRVVARRTLDLVIHHALGASYVASYRELPDGRGAVDILRLNLARQ